MVHEVVTALAGAEVLRRAKQFFAERVPMQAAFPEKEGPAYLTLRGQGGEEIAMAVMAAPGRHAGARLDAAVRPDGGPVPLHAARAVGAGRMTATLPVRVMVQDAWDEVRLELPSATPLAEVKRRALEATRVAGDPAGYCSSFAAPSCRTRRGRWRRRAWCPTAR